MAKPLWACLLFVLAGAVLADSAPTRTPWSVIAGSDLIVVGTLEKVTEDPPSGHDPRVADSRSGKLDIAVQRTLKGSAVPAKLTTDYFVSVGWSDRLLDTIRQQRGKTVIVYLMVSRYRGQSEFSMPGLFGADAIEAYSPAAEQRIRDELAREPRQASDTALYLARLDGGTMESQVKAAIESMASSFEMRRDAGAAQLQKLGCSAVPYIVKHMDDRRPFQGILKGPSSWEAYAQYGPKQMTDALSMVLGFITDPVRPVREGIDDAERRKMIDSWLLYYAHHRMHDANDPAELPDECP